jgi:hypothetical protein
MKEVKKVIQINNEDTLTIDQCDTDMIYAAVAAEDGHIIIVTQPEEDKFITSWLYTDRLWDHNYSADTLEEILEQMLNDNYEVVALDGEEELADWLKTVF